MIAGDFEPARRALEQAFQHSQEQNEVVFDAGLYLQRAYVLENEGQLESAVASFRQAQVQANKDSYALLEFRALLGLNRIGVPLTSTESSRSRELSRRLNNLGEGVPGVLATDEEITLADRGG